MIQSARTSELESEYRSRLPLYHAIAYIILYLLLTLVIEDAEQSIQSRLAYKQFALL